MNLPTNHRSSQRFPIQVPLQYRLLGRNDWRGGTTENISASGILFRCEELADRGTPVEVDFVLFADPNRETGAHVVCRGPIVRSEAQSPAGSPSALAVKILDYQLKHWKRSK